MIELLNIDCMEYMATCKDKQFDLAIVDPPYGINRGGQIETFTKNPKHKRRLHQHKDWDSETPTKQYFQELERVSKNQIIWGANYFVPFLTKGTMGWIFWDKGQDLSMSDGELAYTSFDRALRRIEINRGQLMIDGAIHPTQKPIKLYKWLLSNYAKQGDKILDTHLGSGSSAIAANELGFDFLGMEIDKDYFDAAKQRFNLVTSQTRLALT